MITIPSIMDSFHVIPFLIALFTSYILHQDLNLPSHIKLLLNIPISKHKKVLDCFPCWSFWIGCMTTAVFCFFGFPIYYVTPIAVYMTAVIINKLT